MRHRIIFSFVAMGLLMLFFSFTKRKDDAGWINLLDHNLSQWDMYLGYHHKASYNGSLPMDEHGDTIKPVGYNKNVNNVFSVIKNSGDLVLKVTGEYYGCVFTKTSYKNFELKVKVKFGAKRWEARENKLRDAGILYYSQGQCGVDYWRAWMLSQEFQIMDGHFGDYWNIGNSAISIRAFMPEGSMSAAASNRQPFLSFGTGTKLTGYCMRTVDYSTPDNGWTELTLVCFNGKSLHIVNGQVVMVLSDSRYYDNGTFKPLTEGKIQLQSEGSEVYYKDIQIRPLDKFPDDYKKYFD